MITDLGWEMDDQLALAYICGSSELDLVGVVTTSFYPKENARVAYSIMSWLGNGNVPIGIGTHLDNVSGSKEFEDYFKQGGYPGFWREPSNGYYNGIDLITQVIRKYGSNLNVLVTAPLTDLAKVVHDNRQILGGIGKLVLQGSANISGYSLTPDKSAHNIRADFESAELVFDQQNIVPIRVVGKYELDDVILYTQDIGKWITHMIGYYLCAEHNYTLDFKVEHTAQYEAIYGDKIMVASKPYDAVAAASIDRDNYFRPIEIGKHHLIGTQPEKNTILDPTRLKEHLINTIGKSMGFEQEVDAICTTR